LARSPGAILGGTSSPVWTSSAAIPSTRSGSVDDVVTIDHDRDGLDDFLVLNGRFFAGPVQLIAAVRR
jgi:hypothetical protein